jgi:cation:H+ antiporter
MFLLDFQAQPLWVNLLLFGVAALGVWLAGTFLTTFADLIAERTGLGRAFVGVLLLGGATSLPELATTATAAAAGNAVLAGNNLFGGVAMQIAVLAGVDAIAMRHRAFTFVTPQPVLLMQGVLFNLLMAMALAGIAAGELLAMAAIGFWSTLLAVLYLAALYIIYQYEGKARWVPSGNVETTPKPGLAVHAQRYADMPTWRIWGYFAASSGGVLASGFLVARTGDALAVQTGLGSSFVGATLVALTTSLPEVSTTFAAVRLGAYGMAVGNILGTNSLTLALFFVADLFYRDGLIFMALPQSAAFLGALGIAVTCLYLWGLLERRDKTVLGMGIDSVAVLVLYVGGLIVLYIIR